MRFTPSRRLLLAASAAALLTASAALSSGPAAAADELETKVIRYQSSTGADVSPLELADALGYLAPITLERVGDVQGGPANLQAAATGQVDIASAFNGAVLNIVAAGAPLTSVVSWRGTNELTSPGLYALDDGKTNTARDLIGKKIGVNTLGANQEAVSSIYLAKGGLSPEEIKQVTFVPLPTPNVEQSLRNGQISAASLGFTFRDAALARGGIKALTRNVDLLGSYNDNTGVLRNDFIAKNPNTTKHLVSAIARAIAWSQQKEKEDKRAEVVEVYSKYLEAKGRGTGLAPLKYWQSLGIETEGGWIKKEDFAMWVGWLNSRGEVDGSALDLSKVYSNDFNPYWKGHE
ncbi:ABC transporter substrate-binding protein [Ancylobacter oerskovii]|uniref:ABC transporter substrate-binding protein n=1 Tax=Ancylobacter oerskovii TaxID=459519 RepID=A0ABW4Z224_9HYPH|nr:ABC transporter substrate-binding protein [Ancylobacter oerskovii]MBS7544856.1 ABC transporter substrate-binding protein [Ancylobacter oerskovii]